MCEAADADRLSVVSVNMIDRCSFLVCRDADAARALLAANGKPYGEGTLTLELAKSSRGGRSARQASRASQPAARRGEPSAAPYRPWSCSMPASATARRTGRRRCRIARWSS